MMEELTWSNEKLHRRTLLSAVATLASGLLLLSCDSSTVPVTSPPAQKNFVLALVAGVQNDAFYTTMQKGAQARANDFGVTLLFDAPARFEAGLQIPIVNAMIAKKVDALIIAACDKEMMIEPLQRAHDAGIKIISVDTYIGDGNYDQGPITFPISYIGSDNVEGGRMAGIALIKALGGQGKIYIQNVSPGISTIAQREQGCRSAIQATNGAVTLVGVAYDNDSSTTARQQTATILQHVDDLTGIFGANLFSAEGAAQAIKDANKQGTIKVASFDAPEQAIVDLRNGIIDLIIAQKPADMGYTAVEYAVKALNGETSGLHKRVVTGYVTIDTNNVNTPEAQNAIYKSK